MRESDALHWLIGLRKCVHSTPIETLCSEPARTESDEGCHSRLAWTNSATVNCFAIKYYNLLGTGGITFRVLTAGIHALTGPTENGIKPFEAGLCVTEYEHNDANTNWSNLSKIRLKIYAMGLIIGLLIAHFLLPASCEGLSLALSWPSPASSTESSKSVSIICSLSPLVAFR